MFNYLEIKANNNNDISRRHIMPIPQKKHRRIRERKIHASLELYLNEIGEFSPLTPNDEVATAIKIRKNDGEAFEKMVTANLRFVVTVAKEYQGQGVPLQDLISEGNFGLIKAAQLFDETRGFKFISYAVWWIRQSILRALAEDSRVVRLPLNRVGTLNKINRAFGKVTKRTGRFPYIHEIAEQLEMTPEEVNEALLIGRDAKSMDEPLSNSDDNNKEEGMHKTLPSDRFAPPDNHLLTESLVIEVEKVLSTLDTREAEVVKMYFGIGHERSHTLEEVGEHFKVTRERARQIKEKALRRLRHRSRTDPLRKYLG